MRFEFDPVVVARRAVDRLHDVDRRGLRPRPGRAADGSGGRDVVTTPGHYIEPSFSPDGKLIVYRTRAATSSAGPLYGDDPGIYVVAGGRPAPPRLVREGGTEPQFDHTGKRIYCPRRATSKFVLVSVGLGDADRGCRTATRSSTSSPRTPTQIVPSPDGKWVAFAERYHTYVAPFPQTGRPVDLGPAIDGVSRSRAVSRDAGHLPALVRRQPRGHWALGPELFTRDLVAHLRVPRRQPREARRARGEGRADRLHGADRRAGRRDRLRRRADHHDGRRRRHRQAPRGVIENGTVVVEGNRITASGRGVGPVPAGREADRRRAARRSSRASSTSTRTSAARATASSRRRTGRSLANLAFGVTTLARSVERHRDRLHARRADRAGAKLGPRLFSTGTILYGAETPFKADDRQLRRRALAPAAA